MELCGSRRPIRRGDGVSSGVTRSEALARHGVHRRRRSATVGGFWGLVRGFPSGQPRAADPIRDSTRRLGIIRKRSHPHANSVPTRDSMETRGKGNKCGRDLMPPQRGLINLKLYTNQASSQCYNSNLKPEKRGRQQGVSFRESLLMLLGECAE